jgi:hypothetical protein
MMKSTIERFLSFPENEAREGCPGPFSSVDPSPRAGDFGTGGKKGEIQT